jgi:hypothetical protein
MNITYTWSVYGIKKVNNSQYNNAIVQTYWKKTGTNEDGVVGDFSGATPFELATVDPNNFVSYDDLTEELVLGWIQNVVNEDFTYRDHIDAQIEKKIYEQIKEEIDEFHTPWYSGEVYEAPLTPGEGGE